MIDPKLRARILAFVGAGCTGRALHEEFRGRNIRPVLTELTREGRLVAVGVRYAPGTAAAADDSAARVDFVGTWEVDIASPAEVRAILDAIGEPVTILGVEQPKEVYRHGKDVNQADPAKAMKARVGITRNLLVTRGQGDRFAAIVETLCPGVRVFYSQADKIRQAVLAPLPKKRSKKALDNHVAAMIQRLIRGWPERSNSHNRDAAVAALWAARRSLLAGAA